VAMGRPPKPVEIKRRLGNPGKRRLPELSETVALPPSTGVPTPPRGLKAAGKTTWTRLWSAGAGFLSPKTDYDLLVRLCEAHDERVLLRKLIAKEGRILYSDKATNETTGALDGITLEKRGAPYVHPAVWLLMKVDAAITRYEGLCGFTPSDRAKVGLAEVKRVSRLQDFLANQGVG
jgi:P27 family predicted phage terminase small subunit